MNDSASSPFDFDNFRATSSTASVVGTDSDSRSLKMTCSIELDDATDDITTDGTATDGIDDDAVTTGNTSTGRDVGFLVFLTVSGSASVT